MRRSMFAVMGLAFLATVLLAQEAPQQGKITKVDPDKGTVTIATTSGRERTFTVTQDTRIMAAGFKPLPEGLKGLKEGAAVMFRVGKKDGRLFLEGIVLASPPNFDPAKLKPLTEMGNEDYGGFKGGLYPDGKNERPPAHEKAGVALAKEIQPLDADGKPSPDGKIVIMSAGMSNTTQVYSAFRRLAHADPDKNRNVVAFDGAQGGMTASVIQNLEGRGGKYWEVVDNRLKEQGLTRAQVQVVWMKQADAGPNQGFPNYAKTLQEDEGRILQLIRKRFPNVKLAYLSSRTSAFFAKIGLNPEPYAFESGFSVKWLIEQQIKGDPELNFDPAKGEVKAPWLSWGPYLWTKGDSKRADGFYYVESDFGADGTHPSKTGQEKVARLLLDFFKNDSTTRGWFRGK